MAFTKPLASLSPSLLARKGAARPAMRPQGFAFSGSAPASLDDLGWNDMGTAELDAGPGAAPVPTAPIPPVPTQAAPIPTVLVDRNELARRIEAPAAVRDVSLPTARRFQRETAHAGKAALTLRLDADRHLKLRLAGAITNRSAQDLMIQALDALLVSVPAVDALVAQLPATPPRKR